MPWWPGMRAGDDRRVVGERDGGQRRHRAVTERDAHLDEARDVRRFAARAHVVEHVGVRAVEEERDHVARPLRRIEHVDERFAVLDGDVRAVGAGRAAEERGDRGRGVDQAGGAGDHTERLHALAADHHRRAGLHDPDRAVLAEVAALVFPVVRGRVDHAQVGRGRRVEELRGLRVRERVGVVVAVRVESGPLGLEPDELVGRLVAERVAALVAHLHEVAGLGALEGDAATGRERLVAVVAVGEHHVDDGLERRIEQDLEGPIGGLPVLVGDLVRGVRDGAGHGSSIRPVVARLWADRRARYPVSFAGWPPLAPSSAALRSSPLTRPSEESCSCCARLRPAPTTSRAVGS